MLAIFKRETKSYYTGMIGYVADAVVAAFLGLYFTVYNLLSAAPDFASVLYSTSILLLFVLPALSMRSFAEERRAGTDQLLLTAPVGIPSIVLGKFLAQLAVYAMALVPACVMPLILTRFGALSLVSAYAALLAFFLLGGACLALGTWLSAMTENQILAYLSTFALLLLGYMMDSIQTLFTSGNTLAFLVFAVVLLVAAVLVGVLCKSVPAGSAVFAVGAAALVALFQVRPAWLVTAFNAVLGALALFDPFRTFVGGVFSLQGIVYYLSVTALFLLLTGQTLEKRRWS